MKIKKVLCLGAVLGAVLSVGMVVSASAEPTTDTQPGHYKLTAENLLGDASTTNASWTGEYQGLSFTTVNVTGNSNVELDSTDSIEFKVNGDGYYATILLDPKNSKDAKLFAGAEDQTGTVISAKTNTSVPLNKGTVYKLQQSNGKVVVEEIEITEKQPDITVLVKNQAEGSQNSKYSERIAIFKDNNTNECYAVALISAKEAQDHNSIEIISGDPASGGSTTGVQTKVFESLKVGTNELDYDADYFGSNKYDYLYAVKISNSADQFTENSATFLSDKIELKFQ